MSSAATSTLEETIGEADRAITHAVKKVKIVTTNFHDETKGHLLGKGSLG